MSEHRSVASGPSPFGRHCLSATLRRLDDSWLGDVLAGIAFAIMAIGLIWGAGLAQAVMQ